MQIVKFKYQTRLNGKIHTREPLTKTLFALDTGPTPDPKECIEQWNNDPSVRNSGFTYELVEE